MTTNESSVQNNKKSPPVDSLLFFDIQHTPKTCTIEITVPQHVIEKLFDAAAYQQQKHVKTPGFDFGAAPIIFIKQNYEASLVSHLKEFLFKYCVANFLYRTIRTQKLVVPAEPRLTHIHVAPNTAAVFMFEYTKLEPITVHEWKYLPFKAPKRKNYKDLDRQVENFITYEEEQRKQHAQSSIQENDWVALDITMCDADGTPLIDNFTHTFWLHVSDESVDNPLRHLLRKARVGDTFVTTNRGLQEYFSKQFATNYHFKVHVKNCVPYAYFCLEQFKHHFRIRTKKDLYKKLISVFSYRNDMSQRRATVEECLKLLLAKHPLSVPAHIVQVFKQELLENVRENPDYNVYRTQKDFESLLQSLAHKQAKESIFLDVFAYHEKLQVSHDDVASYLNFDKRGRTKEFIYCSPPIPLYEGEKTLISQEELKRYCLREKAINHAIFHLTKD